MYMLSVSSATQSCPTLCDPMECSMPGFPVHHQLLELTQTHDHLVGDAIQQSHPLSSTFPPTLNLSEYQDLFKWVSSPHQVCKCWSFSFSIRPFNEYSGLMSFRMDWLDILFQSCGHCWVFQICWHIECSTFTASPFRIWNSSTGIPSPTLALFVVMLPKAHLTSHSRMSDSRLAITLSWLSGLWRSFLYSSSIVAKIGVKLNNFILNCYQLIKPPIF